MEMSLGWTRPSGPALRYCLRVAVASFAGYVLSLGDVTYAMYGAFTAALVVGASRGEDIGSAFNRARGSIAGMVAGLAVAQLPQHPAINVALGVALTGYICMGCGWGQAAVRVGASLCAVTILSHQHDALGYVAWRIANTVIGCGAGLLVSYFVLPVKAEHLLATNIDRALEAIARLLEVVSRPERSPADRKRFIEVFDTMVALQKTLVDARKEIGSDFAALRERAQHVAVACFGALGAGMAYADLGRQPGDPEGIAALREQAMALAVRARASESSATPSFSPAGSPGPDHVALQAMALGLRKIDEGLRGLGH